MSLLLLTSYFGMFFIMLSPKGPCHLSQKKPHKILLIIIYYFGFVKLLSLVRNTIAKCNDKALFF